MKVNVIIVTFNRNDCLMKLIKAIYLQTHKPERIIIVNNFSTDSTHKTLVENGYIDDVGVCELSSRQCNGIEIDYYLNDHNSGGSGGFAKAFEIALKYPEDYLWIMDDDVLPESNCLELLLNGMSAHVEVCIPNRSDSRYTDRPCVKLDLKSTFKNGLMKRKTFVEGLLDSEWYNVFDMPFEGPLVSYNVIRKVGLPNAEYFILCDDTDYAYRIKKVSDIHFITSAILHRQLAPQKKKGNKIMNWRDYYALRNEVLFCRQFGENWMVRNVSPIYSWVWWITLSIYKKRFPNIYVINRAISDGMHNRYGKIVVPGEL